MLKNKIKVGDWIKCSTIEYEDGMYNGITKIREIYDDGSILIKIPETGKNVIIGYYEFEPLSSHIVLKRDDIEKYLDAREIEQLDILLGIINNGREKNGKKAANEYYICNKDEPYAEVVYGVIMGGEAVKNKMKQ